MGSPGTAQLLSDATAVPAGLEGQVSCMVKGEGLQTEAVGGMAKKMGLLHKPRNFKKTLAVTPRRDYKSSARHRLAINKSSTRQRGDGCTRDARLASNIDSIKMSLNARKRVV